MSDESIYKSFIASREDIKLNNDGIYDANYSEHLKTKKIAVHWIELPPGDSSSRPHAESLEEEFVMVVQGHPHAWINGYLYPLNPGNVVGFPAGTGIAHTFINNSKEYVHLVVLGERTKKENKCSFPINPELKETHKNIWWENSPPQKIGPHDGQVGNLQHIRDWKDLDFVKDISDLKRGNPFSYAEDSETFPKGARITDHMGLKFLGLWFEVLPPQKRSSWPHVHKLEEELCLVLKGNPQAWMNGYLYNLKPGDVVFFPPGTSVTHTLINNSSKDVEYLSIGFADDAGADERIYYPFHENQNELNRVHGWFWDGYPREKYGPHLGVPDMHDVKVEFVNSAQDFVNRISPELYKKEAEYSLLLGLSELAIPKHQYFIMTQKNQFIGAGLVSDVNLVLTQIPGPYLPNLVNVLSEEKIVFPGVVGPSVTAESFARFWCEKNKISFKLGMSQKVYKLESVISPKAIKGKLIQAGFEHSQLVAQWLLEFSQESLPHQSTDLEKMQKLAESKIKKSEAYLWIDEKGDPVSMNLVGRPTKNGISVSGVYTPIKFRRKGYASAVTAGSSAEMLKNGKKFCVLYTDVSNPTSNKIYQDMGYKEVARSKQFIFSK